MTDPATAWSTFSGRLRRFIRKAVPQEADAEDVLQDVFLRLQAGLGAVRDASKLESWLYQITRNAIVDHRRRRMRTSDVRDEAAAPTESENENALVASWLRPFMAELSAEDQEALRHSELDGHPQRVLAARLGLSDSAARSRVQRARRRLKDKLLECCRIELDRRGNALSHARRSTSCKSDSCDCG